MTTNTEALLRRDEETGRYVWCGGYDTKELPKAARFRWDPVARHWWTDKAEHAAKLAQHGDQEVKAELTTLSSKRDEALSSSRASTASISVPVPDGLSYRNFQLGGIAYALQRKATLIADDMGLGKTIQAAGVINADDNINTVLVVCPASLRLNWQRELEKWLVRDFTIGIATTQAWPNTDVVIANYDIAWRAGVVEHVQEQTWDLAILDESHYVKNPKAKRTICTVGAPASKQRAATTGIRARRRLALTGTPVTNRPVEMFPTLHWLDSKAWPNFFRYANRYCAAHQGRFGWDFSGASNLSELQDTLRSTLMVRRLKADVLTELPAKQRHVVEVPANGASKVVKAEQQVVAAHDAKLDELRIKAELAKAGTEEQYKQAVKDLAEANRVAFSEMATVRHDTAVAKVPAVLSHAIDALEASGSKLVVFAHHHDVVDALKQGLHDYNPVVLDGRTEMSARQEAVDRFQDDQTCKVFIGGIQAAGVGLTLTAASHVLFAELDWTPGNVTQAEDRLHRIGQRDSVLVQHIVLEGSLDARMARTLVAKQDVIDASLDKLPESQLQIPELAAAVTKTTEQSAIAQQAQQLTEADVQVIHKALKTLSSFCDGAKELDMAGFNKFDTRIGHSLAEADKLTAKQAVLGLKVVRKYRRQLGEDVVAALATAASRGGN